MNNNVSSGITVNTDGGSRGNPGPAGWAFVVKEEGRVIHQAKGILGISTNNQAEYAAVLNAMTWLTHAPNKTFHEVHFILDSELVARQLSGVYKIKDEALKRLAIEIKDLERKIGFSIDYNVVRREHNKEADFLVNQVLDENQSVSHQPAREGS